MNKDFEERSKEVLSVLSVLASEADVRGEELVFVGGSAVQSILKNPRRLSIDLDVCYSADPVVLASKLEATGRVVEKRVSRNPLFEFYRVTKGNVLVKVDFLKTTVPKECVATKTLNAGSAVFNAKIAAVEYLVASKLSALSIGAIGRREGGKTEEVDILKDIFDFDCLAKEFRISGKTAGILERITCQQNELRNTKYDVNQVYEAVWRTLRETAVINDKKPKRITKGALENFDEYLKGRGHVGRQELAVMSLRALAYAKMLQKKKLNLEMDSVADERFADREFVSNCEKKLLDAGEDKEELHHLKIFAPKALVYLYYAKRV